MCSGQADPCAALECAPWGPASRGAAAVHTRFQANQQHGSLKENYTDPNQPQGCTLTLSSSPSTPSAWVVGARPSDRLPPAALDAALGLPGPASAVPCGQATCMWPCGQQGPWDDRNVEMKSLS